jgi:hypothetical protein
VGGDRLALLSGARVFMDLAVVTLHEAWMALERRLGAAP